MRTRTLLAAYSEFGLDAGEAFQLRDDLLGVFGDPSHTGKPAGDDLREGKRTVLIACARRSATAAEARTISRLLGDPGLDAAGVAELQAIIRRTEAPLEVEQMITDLTKAAQQALAARPDGRARPGRPVRPGDRRDDQSPVTG